jgi:hypothetical protein
MRNELPFVNLGVVSSAAGRLTTPAGATACAAAPCDATAPTAPTAPTAMSTIKEGFTFL